MNKTFTIKVEVPSTPTSLYEASKSAQMITKGIELIERKGGKYDAKAIYDYTESLRGAAGIYEFDVRIDNGYITADREAEVIELFIKSLPVTHSIINIQ